MDSFTATTIVDAGGGTPATLTRLGLDANNISHYRLAVTGISLPQDSSNDLPRDGTLVTLSNGMQVQLIANFLNYTMIGTWALQTSSTSNSGNFGVFTDGYQTPTANMPTSGSATYAAAGSNASGGFVFGSAFVPDGKGSITGAAVSGSANIGVNFGTGTVNGSLTNMTARSATDGTITPWNSVTLNGTLSGASLSGSTTGGAAPAGSSSLFAFNSGATGTFKGQFFGPNGQELGAVWTLNDTGGPVNGKTATGVIGATKQ